ncbi:MAG: hypothetical protein K9L78_04840 [Victivallales bacterium]|nr:hypothetical protein [Victivallales bacterium]MCF7889429.1 hypothetical protein [Victivallales bacterium]
MQFCDKCKIPYDLTCPVCEAKRQLKLKDKLIEKILRNNEVFTDNRVLDIEQVSKAIHRKISTIYQDRCRCNDLNLPFKKNGKKLTILQADLKKWAVARGENLNLVNL